MFSLQYRKKRILLLRTTKEKELESKFQARLKKEFYRLGWAKIIRQLRAGANGEADLVLCHPGCPPVFVEAKRIGEPLTPLQQWKRRELQAMGFAAFRVDPSEMPLDPKRWSPSCFRL